MNSRVVFIYLCIAICLARDVESSNKVTCNAGTGDECQGRCALNQCICTKKPNAVASLTDSAALSKSMANEASQRFPGLFYTMDEIKSMKNKNGELIPYYNATSGYMSSNARQKRSSSDCCATVHANYVPPATLYNIHGASRIIIDSPPQLVQAVMIGTCQSSSTPSCTTCVVETRQVKLLVLDNSFSPAITFDDFNMDAYCKCL